MTAPLASPDPASSWEWKAELESGVSIATGEPWHGHRVRYRDRGTRRWRSFLLSVDDGTIPTDAMIETAIARHANGGR